MKCNSIQRMFTSTDRTRQLNAQHRIRPNRVVADKSAIKRR